MGGSGWTMLVAAMLDLSVVVVLTPVGEGTAVLNLTLLS